MIEMNHLHIMTKMLLKMLAEIKTCEYFKKEQLCVNLIDNFYFTTVEAFFSDLINKFNKKLSEKLKLRRLFGDTGIDFSVNSN